MHIQRRYIIGVRPIGLRSASLVAPSLGIRAIRTILRGPGQDPSCSTMFRKSAKLWRSNSGSARSSEKMPVVRCHRFPWVHALESMTDISAGDGREATWGKLLAGQALFPKPIPMAGQRRETSSERGRSIPASMMQLGGCRPGSAPYVTVQVAWPFRPLSAAPKRP